MVVASSTLCNLLLEFSPSKEPILELGAIDLLCSLTHKYEPALVLNGVWGLMVSIIQFLMISGVYKMSKHPQLHLYFLNNYLIF